VGIEADRRYLGSGDPKNLPGNRAKANKAPEKVKTAKIFPLLAARKVIATR